MRSYIRYYTIKSGFSKRNIDPNKFNKRGRRKEWRKKLDSATNYYQFQQIDIQEPVPVHMNDQSGHGHGHGHGKGVSSNADDSSDKGAYGSNVKNNKSHLKRAQSCVELDHVTINIPEVPSSPNRTNSSNDLTQILAQYQDLEKELGMTGYMIVNTTSRLREARLQASSSSSSSSSSKVYKKWSKSRKRNGYGSSGSEDEVMIDSIQEDADANALEMDSDEGSSEIDTLDEVNILPKLSDQNDNDTAALKFLLSGVVKRNHLSVNDLLMQDARSVMECGRHQLSSKARDIILGYHEEVERCLEFIAESPLKGESDCARESVNPISGANSARRGGTGSPSERSSPTSSRPLSPPLPLNVDLKGSNEMELSDRMNLIRKLKHNMGRTALMLSGGGAQAMYHLGTIKALCESDRYDDIQVISGTSGGSITAAMCAIKNQDELLKHVCVSEVSTDFMLNGEMARKNIRWFPKLMDMGAYWLKHRLLVDSDDFKRCCEFYYGDTTFSEAFEKTGKHCCITVSASRAESGGAQRLLLNHISTPHVTLASAVAASCALPGVMAPAKLRTKDSEGRQELFEVDGVEWIDGSVQADLPFKRISTLFNVSSYIVCQTNFHVLPFLHKAHHPNMKSLYWKVFQTCEWDIRSRALNLSRLGLFPKIFGQDISKVFKQKYHGDLTLVPRFTTLQVFGLKSLVNPDVDDMKIYLQNGQSAAWPYLGVIKEMLRLERAIDKCMNRLIEQRRQLTPEDDDWDDIESITSATQSNRSRILGSRRETELLKQKILSLEIENRQLTRELESSKKKI